MRYILSVLNISQEFEIKHASITSLMTRHIILQNYFQFTNRLRFCPTQFLCTLFRKQKVINVGFKKYKAFINDREFYSYRFTLNILETKLNDYNN